jgi:valyl-tRNA synthetase
MPFVTEEIYQRMPARESESIMVASFPRMDARIVDDDAEQEMATVMGVIDVIRNIRGEMGVQPNVKVDAHIRADGARGLLEEYGYHIKELAKVEELRFLSNEKPSRAAMGIHKGIEVFVPITDVETITRELSRIEKELGKAEHDMTRAFNKINNRDFRAKAPESVIKKEENVYEELRGKREKLLINKQMLENLLGG